MCWGQQGGAVGLAVWPTIGCWTWHCWVTVNAAGLMEDAHWCPLLTVCLPLPCAICHRDSEPLQHPAGSGKVQGSVRHTSSFLMWCWSSCSHEVVPYCPLQAFPYTLCPWPACWSTVTRSLSHLKWNKVPNCCADKALVLWNLLQKVPGILVGL